MANSDLNKQNLKIIIILRFLAILGQFVTIFSVHNFLKIPLKTEILYLILFISFSFNIFSSYLFFNLAKIEQSSLLAQLCFDIFILFALLYFTGGAENPFISLFIIPIIIGLFILPKLQAILLTILTIILYLALSFYKTEIPHIFNYHLSGFFALHLRAMFFSSLLILLIISVFIIRIRQNIKDNEEKIEFLLNKAILNKNHERYALLAAAYSHKLSTPMNSMILMLENLKADKKLKKDIIEIELEAQKARAILTALRQDSHKMQQEDKQDLSDFFVNLQELWIGNKFEVQLKIHNKIKAKLSCADLLHETLFNLCDNAFESGAKLLEISTKVTKDSFIIEVKDDGAAIDKALLNKLGKVIISNKGEARGMGFFLANKIVKNLGGKLIINSAKSGLKLISLQLPINLIEL